MLNDSEEIIQKATRSLKWSALMEIVSRTASPIIFVILARILSPNDFGVMATAIIVISFAQMFWDAGLSKALIQTKENHEDAAHVVFWTNGFLGLVIYILLFLLAPWIANFFRSPDSVLVLRVLGLQIILASLTSTQQALFLRALDFRHLFWIRLITAFIPGLFSIPLALYGYGVWALVAGSLAGQFFNMILIWSKSPWQPKLQFDAGIARKLFRFGIWAVAESFAAWFIMWGDNLLVGRFLGIHDLGVYRTGSMMVTILFGLVLNPFVPVVYPTFSRLQNDIPALQDTFHNVNRVIMAIALPMGVGFLLVGPELANVLFGAKWQGLGFVLSIIGFMFGIAWIVGINPELYRAMGRPDVNTKLMFITILYYLPAYYVAAQYGLHTFTITRLIVALVATPIHIYLCIRMLGVSPFYLWQTGKYIISATFIMGIIVFAIKHNVRLLMPDVTSLMMLFILIITGITIYFASLFIMDRSFIAQIGRLVKRAGVS